MFILNLLQGCNRPDIVTELFLCAAFTQVIICNTEILRFNLCRLRQFRFPCVIGLPEPSDKSPWKAFVIHKLILDVLNCIKAISLFNLLFILPDSYFI